MYSNKSGGSSNVDDGTPVSETKQVEPTQSKSINSFGQISQVFTEISIYKGTLASLKSLKKDHVELTRKVLLEFNEVYLIY